MLNEIKTMQIENCIIHICSDSIQENEEEILEQFSNISCRLERRWKQMSKREQKIYQIIGQATAMILFSIPFGLILAYGFMNATTLN